MTLLQTVPDHTSLVGVDAPTARRRSYRIDPLGPHAWIALVATLVATIIMRPAPEAGGWLWAIALLFIGMPHGAYDLEAIRRITASFALLESARLFSVYTLIMFGCAVALLIAPTISLIAFLALTVHHFGHSDSVWTRHQTRPAMNDRLPAWGHGSVVIAAPFFFAPSAAWAPFEAIATMLGAQIMPSAASLRIAAAFVLLAAVAAICFGTVRLVRTQRSWDAVQQTLVLGLTLALAAVAPPLIAVGAYFIGVHALGHCLTATTPPRSRSISASFANVYRVHVRSLPLLLPSLAIVFALTGCFVDVAGMPDRIASAFLLFCAVATLPHHMLWADSSLLAPQRHRLPRSARPHNAT